jgi:uncharacterized protein (DUF302 family)
MTETMNNQNTSRRSLRRMETGLLSLLLLAMTWCGGVSAQDAADYPKEVTAAIDQLRQSNALPFPVPTMMDPFDSGEWVPNTVIEPFPEETRSAMLQSMAASNPWSLRQVFNFMALKMKAEEGLTFEEVVEAMDSRAIEENLKRLGPDQIGKEVAAKTGNPDAPKLEIHHYCDAMVARSILDYSPEFSIFLPCRISVLEDANGDVWLMTLDWDVSWLNFVWHPDSQIDAELKKEGQRIRDAMVSIMEAGATGAW